MNHRLNPGSRPPNGVPEPHPVGGTLRLVLSWLWVGVPLAWGVYETILRSLKLFQ